MATRLSRASASQSIAATKSPISPFTSTYEARVSRQRRRSGPPVSENGPAALTTTDTSSSTGIACSADSMPNATESRPVFPARSERRERFRPASRGRCPRRRASSRMSSPVVPYAPYSIQPECPLFMCPRLPVLGFPLQRLVHQDESPLRRAVERAAEQRDQQAGKHFALRKKHSSGLGLDPEVVFAVEKPRHPEPSLP